ncbi:MAG: hypothetical protein AB7F76_00480 [Parvibaculaceae bacterium]
MQPTTSFDPQLVAMLGGVLAEIEAEMAARGQSLSEASRTELSMRIMDIAATGECDRNAIKHHALGHNFPDKSFLDKF